MTVYGTRQSLSSYEKQRKFLSMESRKVAVARLSAKLGMLNVTIDCNVRNYNLILFVYNFLISIVILLLQFQHLKSIVLHLHLQMPCLAF